MDITALRQRAKSISDIMACSVASAAAEDAPRKGRGRNAASGRHPVAKALKTKRANMIVTLSRGRIAQDGCFNEGGTQPALAANRLQRSRSNTIAGTV